MEQTVAAELHTGTHRFAPAFDPSRVQGPSLTEALVDPASLFRDPAEVAEHPWFTREEKRTILLSWARDEFALEQMADGSLFEPVPQSRIDRVVDALARLDAPAASEYRAAIAAIRARRHPSSGCRWIPSSTWRRGTCRNASLA